MKKTQKNEKNAKTDKFNLKYVCKICDYSTANKYDFKRHLSTKKHKKKDIAGNAVSIKEKKTQKTQKIAINYCICGRRFQTRSGEWKHKKKCTFWDMHTNKNVSKNVSNNLQIVSKIDNLGNTNPCKLIPIHGVLDLLCLFNPFGGISTCQTKNWPLEGNRALF